MGNLPLFLPHPTIVYVGSLQVSHLPRGTPAGQVTKPFSSLHACEGSFFDTISRSLSSQNFPVDLLQIYNARKGGIQESHSILPSPPLTSRGEEVHTKTYALLQRQKISSSNFFELSKRRLEDSSVHIHSFVSVSY